MTFVFVEADLGMKYDLIPGTVTREKPHGQFIARQHRDAGLGRALRRLRTFQGITVQGLAARLEVDPLQLVRVEEEESTLQDADQWRALFSVVLRMKRKTAKSSPTEVADVG